MSANRPGREEDADRPAACESSMARSSTRIAVGRERVIVAAGALTLLAVSVTTAARVLTNLPSGPVAAAPAVREAAVAATPFVVAASLAAVALATDRAPLRVGVLFVAVFGVLQAFSRAAVLPGVAGVAAGSGAALAGTLGVPSSYRAARRSAVALGFAAGIALSLFAAVGIAGAGLRSTGGVLVAVSLVGIGLRVGDDRLGLAASVLAFIATAAAVASAPYVAGAVLLVAFAVVGVPGLLVAAAVGSCVGVAVAALRRREYATAIGAGVLLVAGLPASFPRAMAVAFGALLVLVPVEALAGGGERSRREVTQ